MYYESLVAKTAILIAACFCFFYVGVIRPKLCKKEKEEEEAMQQKIEESKKRRVLQRNQSIALVIFSVELKRIHEPAVANKIVNKVNSLASQTAVAYVNKEKEDRGEEVDQPPKDSSWKKQVANLRGRWRTRRDFALRIAPELKTRIPHFSVFEPLKSYTEECREKQLTC